MPPQAQTPSTPASPPPAPPPRPELLLLDAGNTLVFFDHEGVVDVLRDAGFQGLEAARLAAGEAEAKRRYEGLVAQQGHDHESGWHLYVQTVLVEGGLPEDRAAEATRRLRAHHEGRNLWRRVPEGLPDALSRAREAGMRLAVISNAEGTVEALLAEVGLRPFFETVVDSSVVGVAKPDPRIFEEALRRLGVPAARAVYAGDIPRVDVDGARGAGLEGVLIDAFDHYPSYQEAARFPSVAALIDGWLAR